MINKRSEIEEKYKWNLALMYDSEEAFDKDKEKAEEEIKDLKEALEKDDLEDIKSKKEKLNETAMALATKVYEEAAKQAQNEQASDDVKEDKKDDDVIDADYEEK